MVIENKLKELVEEGYNPNLITSNTDDVLGILSEKIKSQNIENIIFADLQRKAGQQKLVGRIRKIKVTEPLDGISESTVTIRYGDRLRVVAIRFEGLDQRWLCTALTLI